MTVIRTMRTAFRSSPGRRSSAEPGLGALTLPGFLREVTTPYGEREALVARSATASSAGPTTELWERAVEVARALRACGVGKDGRVGVLMTNRPEWVAAVFGVVAGRRRGRPAQHVLHAGRARPSAAGSGVSVLLFERTVLKKDFAAMLTELEPRIATQRPARCSRPGTRSCAASRRSGRPRPASTPGTTFLARGQDRAARAGRGDGRGGAAERSGRAVLLVGFHQQAQGHSERAPRRRHPAVALPAACTSSARRTTCAAGAANGFFWSGNFAHGARRDTGQRRRSGAAADLRRRRGAGADGGRTGELPVRLAAPVGAARGRAQLAAGGPEQHAVRGLQAPRSRGIPRVSARWSEPGHAYGNTETFTITTCFPANTPPRCTRQQRRCRCRA